MNEKVDIRVHFGNLADLSVYVTGTWSSPLRRFLKTKQVYFS